MPSRIRLNGHGVHQLGVGDELTIEGVRDAALEASQRFEFGQARGLLASVVDAAWSVQADLG